MEILTMKTAKINTITACLFASILFLVGCEKKSLCDMVHPHDAKNNAVTLTLSFNTAWEAEELAMPYSYNESDYNVRYTVEFWTIDVDGNVVEMIDRIQQIGSTLSVGANSYAIKVDLPSFEVRVLCWADYVLKGNTTNNFFDISSLQRVHLLTPYGAIAGRDAFLNVDTWDFTPNVYEQNGIDISKTIELKRPFAKYKIYTHDVEQYLGELQEAGEPAVLPVKNRIEYQLWFPTEYNVHLMNVINPATSISYLWTPSLFNEGASLQMAEDLILVSPNTTSNSYYNLIIYYLDETGEEIKVSKNIGFYVLPNHITLAYGNMLVESGLGSPGIDDSFDQEIIVPVQ